MKRVNTMQGLVTVLAFWLAAAGLFAAAVPLEIREELALQMTQAKLEADLGHFDSASQLFSSVAEDDTAPANMRWEALVRLGLARNAAGDYQGGSEAFRQVTASFADDPEAIRLLTFAVAGTTPGKNWIGLGRQFEDLLSNAEIVSVEELIMGENRPMRVYLAQEDIELRAIFRPEALRADDPKDRGTYGIAAYEMDKLLDLEMVPPVVQRAIEGQTGTLQLWVEGCEVYKGTEQLRRAASDLDRQRSRIQTFDSLIGNRDRNVMQILVAPDGDIVIVDHTRSFPDSVALGDLPDRFDRELVRNLRTLDRQDLESALAEVLNDQEIEAVLGRRDALLSQVDDLVAEKGEAQVFF